MSDAYPTKDPLTSLTARVVSAYVQNHVLPSGELPNLIGKVHLALGSLGQDPQVQAASEKPIPAVPIRKSVHSDYLISLEDGRKFKSLRRHLRTTYGMTPEDYRAKWGLPQDYPMVAPGYAAKRSEMAKSFGLGQLRKIATPLQGQGDAVSEVTETAPERPK